MEYVLPLKFIAGIFVNKCNIEYTKETLVCDCIDFLDDIKNLELTYEKNDDLINACKVGNIDLVKLLIGCGADIHAKDDGALYWASRKGHLEIIKFLIENGADVHAWDDIALRWASGYGHLEIVKLLIEYGADTHARNEQALCWASRKGYFEIVKLLIENGADIHGIWYYEALRHASLNMHFNIVNYLKSLKN